MSEPALRRVSCEIDLAAVRSNARAIARTVAPAHLLAVVKARAYGHGAPQVARAALEGGASWLGVATVEEALEIQRKVAPIIPRVMVLSEPQKPEAAHAIVRRGLVPVVYSVAAIEMLAKAVANSGGIRPLPVHLKVDTGMHRVGCDPEQAGALAELIEARSELDLEGLCTHFALADDPGDEYTLRQLETFERVRDRLAALGITPRIVHAANSAAALAFPQARYDLVRVGIALYGIPPAAELEREVDLVPALSLRAHVSHVRHLPRGERVSYGLRYRLGNDGNVAVVPVGYADGVPRNLGLAGGEVLIRGRRYPIAGTVTMDMLMVDVGPDQVEVGDEVVLLGRQAGAEVTVAEWANRLDTISYEIVTGIGPRVLRTYR